MEEAEQRVENIEQEGDELAILIEFLKKQEGGIIR
jgi:UDP-N-acetylglucosamine acyltransferase